MRGRADGTGCKRMAIRSVRFFAAACGDAILSLLEKGGMFALRAPGGLKQGSMGDWKRAGMGLFALLALMGWTTGCGDTIISQMHADSARPAVAEPLNAFAQADIGRYQRATLGVFPFRSPHFARGTGKYVGEMYFQELLRSGVFRQVKMVPQPIHNGEEAIWWGRRENCDLVMSSDVLYFMDGSGNVPTELKTRTEILDVRTGAALWVLEQEAHSDPGKDVDLYWATVSGEPAQRARFLARTLAVQFSQYLAAPLFQEEKKK